VPAGHYGISGLLRSEWTKMRTVRSTTWSLVLVVVLSIGIGALATAETRAHWTPDQAFGFDATRLSLLGVFFAQLVIGVLGILVMSGEYSTGTIRATFSAAPRRPLVLLAKVAVFGAVALVVSEIVAFASFFIGQALLTAPAIHTTLSSPGALRAVVGTGLYLCVLGLFALGLATIIRHTTGAIGAFVGILLVLPIIVAALPNSIADDVKRFLPDAVGRTMISQVANPNLFSAWTGFAVLCIYAAGLLVIGGVLLVRRDA
jgi:ABC-type transport system involved in multi-copper enzyme maturation permease subunit